jgi:hypothetical protein
MPSWKIFCLIKQNIFPLILNDFAQFFISKNLGGVVTSWLSETAARLGSGITSGGVRVHRANAQW